MKEFQSRKMFGQTTLIIALLHNDIINDDFTNV